MALFVAGASAGRSLIGWVAFSVMFMGCLEVALGLLIPSSYPQITDQQVLGGDSPQTSFAPGHLGAVASENAICSQIGIEQLQNGGNAADALVATVFCVGVIGCYHSGIGGGGFMLVRGPNGTYEYIDFRETAPMAASQDMYNNSVNASVFGGLSVGIPGEIRGFKYLHERYGKLPWKQVMQGAIKVARYGWPVNKDLVRYMGFANRIAPVPNFLVDDPNWAVDFAPNGTLVKVNDTITRKRYADTLETIANEGAEIFYTGPMAQDMIKAVQAANGTMTMEDLQSYNIVIRPTANITYRGYNVFSGGAPSSGGVVLSVLKIVEGYKDFFWKNNTNLSTHFLDEAIRFGYGQRTDLGDPFFLPNLSHHEAEMLSEETAAHIRGKISPFHTLNVSAYDPTGTESLANHGTSHVVTSDGDGMAISLTTTLNLLFGSGVMVPETGVIMNDQMNDFSIPGRRNEFGFIPSPANFIRPGKRMMSSITPVIIEHPNSTLYYVVGAAGGSRIITATIQGVVNVLDRNMTAPQALAEPRLHDQLIPNEAVFEYAYDNDTVAFMVSRGHNVSWIPSAMSSAQAIRRLPNGTFEAAGEPRQADSGGLAI